MVIDPLVWIMKQKLLQLFKDLEQGTISIEKAIDHLKYLPYEDFGHIKFDFHRELRTGIGEIIYGKDKTIEMLIKIINSLKQKEKNICITKLPKTKAKKLLKIFNEGYYNELAKVFLLYKNKPKSNKQKKIPIITAGSSDIYVAEEAKEILNFLGSKCIFIYDVGVAGLHRILSYKKIIEKSKVLIVVAGMDGVLPSIIGGIFGKPIIAVPTSVGYGANFKGLSALLTMLNSCAPGVCVVNIDNGFGAAYIAHMLNK